MTQSSSAPGSARPGGRTAKTRQKVHLAVRSLFSEGLDKFSVREVSQRSGVSEVTIYRRWGTVESLVLDVAVTQLNEQNPFPNSGDLREDLLTWAKAVSDQVKTTEGFAFFRAFAAARSTLFGTDAAALPPDETARYLKMRTDQIQLALDRDAAQGGHPPTVEHVLDTVLAPIYLRAIMGYRAPHTNLEELVDRALMRDGGANP